MYPPTGGHVNHLLRKHARYNDFLFLTLQKYCPHAELQKNMIKWYVTERKVTSIFYYSNIFENHGVLIISECTGFFLVSEDVLTEFRT